MEWNVFDRLNENKQTTNQRTLAAGEVAFQNGTQKGIETVVIMLLLLGVQLRGEILRLRNMIKTVSLRDVECKLKNIRFTDKNPVVDPTSLEARRP